MARAAGFGISRGDWIAFCDDDDLWKPNYLQTMSRYLVGDIRFGFANHVAIENGVWGQTDKFSQAPDGYFTTIGDSFYPSLLRWVPLLPSTSIVAADRLREAGGFDQDFGRGLSQDWELELRCVQQGPVAIVPEPLVGIRRHGGNRTNRQLASLLGDIRVLEFARDRHPAASRYSVEIRERSIEKCIEAADLAFTQGRTDMVRRLIGQVPAQRRPWKLTTKEMICRLPVPDALLRSAFGGQISPG